MSKDNLVECQLCPRYCRLAPGQRGDCRARENINGELMTLVYGNPCAIHVDPIEKKPLFHFLPGTRILSLATAGCNLHCQVCQNWEISQRPPEETVNYQLSPQLAAQGARDNDCASIAYTYSEPVIFYEYAFDCSLEAKKQGLKNVLVTAGYINETPLREICPVIDGANIDLKGDDLYYRKYCSGTLRPVQRTIEIMVELGVWVEITNLIVPTLNDSSSQIKKLASWIKKNLGESIPIHFSRFHPNYRLRNLPPTPTETLVKAREIARQEGLLYVYIGNAPRLGGETTVCPNCSEVLIKRKGHRVLSNNLVNGSCPVCSRKLEGIWK